MTRFPAAALTAAFAALAAIPVSAGDYDAPMQAYLLTDIAPWAQDAAIVDAVRAQNRRNAGLTQDEIITMDESWRSEVGAVSTPTIDAVTTGSLADFLRARVEESGGMMTEIIVMDAMGLNVATSHVTSDYWQGDEAKHSETYGTGPAGVHFSDVDFDESSQKFQGQISLTIVDPESETAIGALTVGIDAQALM